MGQQEVRCVVHGRVQMVMFRDFVQRKSRKIALVGYVHNLPDGTVEVVAQGERDTLEKLIAHLHKGSLLAHVARVDVEWRDPSGKFDAFDILYD